MTYEAVMDMAVIGAMLIVLFLLWLWATPQGQGNRFCRECNRIYPYDYVCAHSDIRQLPGNDADQ
jgi:hypothetical protein